MEREYKNMKVLIVYCHPSHHSFTYQVKEHFVRGLKEAKHEYEVIDLYAENFNSDIGESEYLRDAFYDDKQDIPDDVKKYQEIINRNDAIVFIYPVFWTEAPSKLVGWFQRVWTYGFAYGKQMMKTLEKSLFLVNMGGDAKEPLRKRQIEAMKEVMVGERKASRALKNAFIVYDRMSRDYQERQQKMEKYLQDAYLKGKEF